jgi:hypothetical protein
MLNRRIDLSRGEAQLAEDSEADDEIEEGDRRLEGAWGYLACPVREDVSSVGEAFPETS